MQQIMIPLGGKNPLCSCLCCPKDWCLTEEQSAAMVMGTARNMDRNSGEAEARLLLLPYGFSSLFSIRWRLISRNEQVILLVSASDSPKHHKMILRLLNSRVRYSNGCCSYRTACNSLQCSLRCCA